MELFERQQEISITESVPVPATDLQLSLYTDTGIGRKLAADMALSYILATGSIKFVC